MKLPNKSIPYEKSIFPLFPVILRTLNEKNMTVSDLWMAASNNETGFLDFIGALDCLYALGMIDLTEERSLHYVGGNKM